MQQILHRFFGAAVRGRRFLTPGLVALLASGLLAAAAAAAPDVNLGDPCPANPDAAINAQVGTAVAGENIGVTGAAGNVFWAFATAPACAGGPTSFNCNGVTITLPAGSPDTAVANSAEVVVSGTPTASGSFSFRLIVTSEDGTESCQRTYDLVITSPFDVAFVLDRSGSMSLDADGTPGGASRWDALETGVNGFTAALAGVAGAGSRFGLGFFATTAFAPSNAALAGLLDIVTTPTLATQVANELTGQTPSGWTAMGCGLLDGIGKLTNPARARVMVLFTDGEQNQSPQVNANGRDFVPPPTRCPIPVPSVNPSYPAGSGSIKVITVGIWDPGIAYNTTLQHLATENRGTYIATATGTSFDPGGACDDITAAFTCAIQPALAGTSPQLVTSYQGTLGATPVTLLPPFDLNRKVSRLLIQIFYDRSFETPQLAQLLAGLRITRDGADVTQFFTPVLSGNFTDTILLKTDFVPEDEFSLRPEGSWAIEMAKPTAVGGDLGYRVVPFADDHRLDMEWSVDPAAPRAGQSFSPTVRLSWLGRPVTDATVEALILKPGDDVGDLLARNPRKVDPSSNPDDGSPGLQKFRDLLGDADFLAEMLPEEQTLTLAHQGGGTYGASYALDDVTGLYQVVYRVRADNADLGRLQRLAAQSVYVRYDAIDLAASGATTTVRDGGIDIRFRPVRPGGRFVGPANGGGFTVDGAGVSLTDVVDHQDGSYTLVLTGDPDAEVSIGLVGDEIYHGAASSFGMPDEVGRQDWSLHAGWVSPHGRLAGPWDDGVTLNLDYLRQIRPRLAWDLRLGLSRFDGRPGVPDLDVWTLAANLKYTFNPHAPVRLFVNGGGGLYYFDPGDLEGGYNLGVGLAAKLTSDLTAEWTYNYHSTFTASPDVEYSQLQLGLLFSF